MMSRNAVFASTGLSKGANAAEIRMALLINCTGNILPCLYMAFRWKESGTVLED